MFDYGQAFSRNIGWVTHAEQQSLRGKRVAIAGLGGVGGAHLLTLTRLGVGAFHIADFDNFELANTNRQAGATTRTMGQPKAGVLADMARAINPDLDLAIFDRGIDDDNIDEFLRGVDLYVDGLDFFAFGARKTTFDACARLRVPAITVAPLGMGAALLNFLPGGMTFEQFFRWRGCTDEEKALRFLVGLAPAMLHRGYLVDPSAVNLSQQRGPSTPMACDLCAGVAATEALKLLLGRGRVLSAPRGMQFDAYRNRMVRTWRPGGNRHPAQQAALALARRQLSKVQASMPPSEVVTRDAIDEILELARWAPSGDNTQPWRFEIPSEREILVHGYDTRDHCVYDLDGRASQLAHGALLETLALAATRFGHSATSAILRENAGGHIVYQVILAPDASIAEDPLVKAIRERMVQRRPMRPKPIPLAHRRALEEAVQPYSIEWFDSWRLRWSMAKLNARNAQIRLTIPEAYAVHKATIAWGCKTSEDRLPDASLGADPLLLAVMRWAMSSWERVDMLNRYAGGTLMPRLALDVIPGVLCSAHFALLAPNEPACTADHVAAGRALQRFWLTATQLNLQLQPGYTPLVFASYARQRRRFTRVDRAIATAGEIASRLDEMLGVDAATRAVFLGRLGAARAVKGRSLRLPLDRLIVRTAPETL